MVDQTVSVSFKPKRQFLLIETGLGAALQFPATYLPRDVNATAEQEARRLLLAAAVPWAADLANNREAHFTFFLIGEDSLFAATPVKSWTSDKVMENMQTTKQLHRAADELFSRAHSLDGTTAKMKLEIDTLREQVLQIAGIDELVSLKMKLAQLQGRGENNVSEQERLKTLIQRAREMGDPPDIYARMQELSLHLTETAKATALAERLGRRQQEAAQQHVHNKLGLIQEMRELDTTALTQELASLKAERVRLESAVAAHRAPGDSNM